VFEEVEGLATYPVDPNKHEGLHRVYFEAKGRVDTPLYLLDRLAVGEVIRGPAMIIDNTQTIVLDPASEAVVTSKHLFITLI
jgi:5-oxoprolinase (ATP-hydrolysing)